jgi:Holliday junction resolvase RusA-like endonuclease
VSETPVTLTVDFKPVPYVRMTQRGKYVDARAQGYLSSKMAMALKMRTQMNAQGREPFGRDPLGVEIEFVYERGADHRRDCDNEIKAVLDAANGVVWADDRWVDEIRAVRRGGGKGDRVRLTVWRLDSET